MHAYIIEQYGGAEALRCARVADPQPAPGEVQVAVRAVGVNDWDWGILQGSPFFMRLFLGLRKPRVKIAGVDVAGVVSALGEGVTDLQVGDAVYGDLSESGFGGFAEYVCAKRSALTPMPAGMSFQQAAALPHAAMLALQGLREVGDLQAGQRLLINGAGGGVGTLALQMAKQLQVHVTGVDRGCKLGMMRKLGFDDVVDFTREDFAGRGQRYDLILDTRTSRSVFDYVGVLNAGGKYVTVGGHTGRLLQTFLLGRLIRYFTGKQVQVLGLKANKDMSYVNELFSNGGLTPVIDGPFPFSALPAAVARFGEGLHLGKLVVTVS